MRTNDTQKQIDSCKKVFSLLKLFMQGNATLPQATELLSDGIIQNSNTASVTLNKYINTLRTFGINVNKDNKCYKVLNPPYKIDLTDAEYSGYKRVNDFINKLEGDDLLPAKNFIKSMEHSFSEEVQQNILKEKSKNETDFSFYYEKYFDKISTCQRFCSEDFKIEITYYKSGSKREHVIQAKPERLIYEKAKIRFLLIDFKTRQPVSIPINKILSIKQLSSKLISTYKSNNVVIFRMRGRLAENYTPRQWEYLERIEDDGAKVYVNKDEDSAELLHRILRYENSCEVISPQSFKEMLNNEVDDMIKLYAS